MIVSSNSLPCVTTLASGARVNSTSGHITHRGPRLSVGTDNGEVGCNEHAWTSRARPRPARRSVGLRSGRTSRGCAPSPWPWWCSTTPGPGARRRVRRRRRLLRHLRVPHHRPPGRRADAAPAGSGFAQFYARRMRRLLPASFVVLAVIDRGRRAASCRRCGCPAWSSDASPPRSTCRTLVRPAGHRLPAPPTAPSPLQHYWSLGGRGAVLPGVARCCCSWSPCWSGGPAAALVAALGRGRRRLVALDLVGHDDRARPGRSSRCPPARGSSASAAWWPCRCPSGRPRFTGSPVVAARPGCWCSPRRVLYDESTAVPRLAAALLPVLGTALAIVGGAAGHRRGCPAPCCGPARSSTSAGCPTPPTCGTGRCWSSSSPGWPTRSPCGSAWPSPRRRCPWPR